MRSRMGCLAVAAAAVSVVLLGCSSPEDSLGGSGIRIDGEMFWSSGVDVRTAALGRVITRGVQFEDTTADLRRIRGVDRDLAVALRAHRGPEPRAWQLFSSDVDQAADPQRSEQLRDVVKRRRPAAGRP